MPVPTTPIVPRQDAVVYDQPKTVTRTWLRFFNDLLTLVLSCAPVIGSVGLTAQTAAIPLTAVSTTTLAAGRYRVSYYLRVTRAAGTSSSLTVSVESVDNGVTCTQTTPALTANAVAVPQSGAVIVQIDAGTTIRYAVAYASVGIPTCRFEIDVDVEALA